MASSTQLGLRGPPRCVFSDCAVNISTRASMRASGKIARKWRASTVALGRPTSARVATACLLSDDRVTCKRAEASPLKL